MDSLPPGTPGASQAQQQQQQQQGKLRLGSMRSSRTVVVLLSAALALGLLWHFHYSDSGWDSLHGKIGVQEENSRKFICSMMLEGFLVKEESTWGTGLRKEDVLRHWARYDCKRHLTCERLGTFRHRGSAEHDDLFLAMWSALDCQGEFRQVVSPSTSAVKETTQHFKAPSSPAPSRAIVNVTAAPSPTPPPKQTMAAIPSPTTMLKTIPSPTTMAELASLPSPTTMLAAIPSPTTMLAAIPSPTTVTELYSIPSPTTMLATSPATATVVPTSARPTAAPVAPPPTPPPTSPSPVPTIADVRQKYNIQYAPPPDNYTEEVLHWCSSARDKHKIFPNETDTISKVFHKFDTAVPPAKRDYHEKWKKLNCQVVCKVADKWEEDNEKLYVKLIASLPKSTEKRVISFSLYGTNPKYVEGALRNAELVGTYFPGWVCRFYVSSLPQSLTDRLKSLGSEVYPMTGYGNMLSRFLVAADPSVDRYIIRDTDSRLNQRDRLAVEEWIDSGMPIHSIRDHINHCHPLMGGMWGGVKGAIPGFEDRVKALIKTPFAKDYMTDMHFLRDQIWPLVSKKAFQHDTYCCKGFPGSVSLPTRRPFNYLHVGQIFDEFERPVMSHIENHIRDYPNPPVCRHKAHSNWIYG